MTTLVELDHDALLILRSDCQFDSCEPSAIIETEDEVLTFQGVDSRVFTEVLRKLDGTHRVGEIASHLGASQQKVIEICTLLFQHALVTRIGGPCSSGGSEFDFSDLCYSLFPKWKKRVFSHALWCSLADGSASRSVFAGWLLETYHFIETVNSRLALAIAECRLHDARALFRHHYTEEWDHHHFFMSALVRLGFESEAVLCARPLPGTLAVINHMRDTARRDPLYYAACSGFLESTGEDRAAGREFFDRLIRHYCPEKPGIVQPMRDHLDLDEDYQHNGMLSQIYPKLGVVTKERLAGAIDAVAELVEQLELWSTDILRSYADESGFEKAGVRSYRRSHCTAENQASRCA